ncbi:MAG TPA: hypothetical protein VFU35_01310 [Jatrophihabitans sp.]|nr:hypothetical protein [Jatrophihabitans sp.]
MAELPRAAFWPDRTVRLAARVLPAGANRDRYEREFLSELFGMSRGQQTRYAIGVLSRSWTLRVAVRHAATSPAPGLDTTSPAPRIPILCRLHIRHRWATAIAEDGGRYQRCLGCGKDRTEVDSNNFGGKVLGAGLAQIGGAGGMGSGGGFS